MIGSKFQKLARDANGAAAVEFALYSMVFFAMLFGAFYASLLGWTDANLHFAVQAAARCRSIGTACTDTSTTEDFAAKKFTNVTGNTPDFEVDDAATCGNQVTGAIDFQMNWILSSSTIPLTAQACFPQIGTESTNNPS